MAHTDAPLSPAGASADGARPQHRRRREAPEPPMLAVLPESEALRRAREIRPAPRSRLEQRLAGGQVRFNPLDCMVQVAAEVQACLENGFTASELLAFLKTQPRFPLTIALRRFQQVLASFRAMRGLPPARRRRAPPP